MNAEERIKQLESELRESEEKNRIQREVYKILLGEFIDVAEHSIKTSELFSDLYLESMKGEKI